MNLAIVSPNFNTYSETFIQAHKNIKVDNVFFYYGGAIPNYLENDGIINICSDVIYSRSKLITLLKSINPVIFFKKGLSIKEKFFASSLKKNKIDVVLAEFGPTGVACKHVCDTLKIPLITHFHGYDITVLLKEYKKNYVDLIKDSPYVVGVSKDMINTLKELGASDDKAIYTPCGPNPLFYKTYPTFDNNSFVSVGRFVDKKAPYYLILAFKEVVKSYNDAKLNMVGTGPLLNTCRNLVMALGLENNIKFLGIKSPQEIQNLHASSLAFIQHSITSENGDKEGTPVGVMEASASSLPVISTRHAGIKDVIIEGETGLLCDEHEYFQMAKNIIWVIEHKNEAREMGEKGRSFIKNNFSLDQHIGILTGIVKEASKKCNEKCQI